MTQIEDQLVPQVGLRARTREREARESMMEYLERFCKSFLWQDQEEDYGCSDTCEYNTENIEFSVFSSQKGGTDIKVGSTTIHVPKPCSVSHPAVQMVFAEVTSDSFYCPHPMVPRVITDLIEKSSSDKYSNAVQTVYKSGWADARPPGDGKLKNPDTYALATTEEGMPSNGNCTPVLWLDSGAGHHAVGDVSFLCNLRDPPAGTAVRLADGNRLHVAKIGDIGTENFQIPDVYLVPGLQMNVISVRQLAKCKIFPTFYENHAELCRGAEQVGGAIVDDNTSIYRLYYLAAVGNAATSTS